MCPWFYELIEAEKEAGRYLTFEAGDGEGKGGQSGQTQP